MKTIRRALIISALLGIAWAGATGTVRAAALDTCGAADLHIVMEQWGSAGFAWYDAFNDDMWAWNRYMDIYRVTPDDGSYEAGN